ncbi:hypothetical protein TNCV_4281311 [Trichonephila clavipes]|nr:hypothetical protein TNCV_4281311 [Trichonephila clavipes]
MPQRHQQVEYQQLPPLEQDRILEMRWTHDHVDAFAKALDVQNHLRLSVSGSVNDRSSRGLDCMREDCSLSSSPLDFL